MPRPGLCTAEQGLELDTGWPESHSKSSHRRPWTGQAATTKAALKLSWSTGTALSPVLAVCLICDLRSGTVASPPQTLGRVGAAQAQWLLPGSHGGQRELVPGAKEPPSPGLSQHAHQHSSRNGEGPQQRSLGLQILPPGILAFQASFPSEQAGQRREGALQPRLNPAEPMANSWALLPTLICL